MSMTFARLLDPCFEDDDAPFRHYDYRGEPLEDRLYLPCGIDPHKKVCHAAFVHPLPHRQEILSHREIQNQHLSEALWLVEEGQRLEGDGLTEVFGYAHRGGLLLGLGKPAEDD